MPRNDHYVWKPSDIDVRRAGDNLPDGAPREDAEFQFSDNPDDSRVNDSDPADAADGGDE